MIYPLLVPVVIYPLLVLVMIYLLIVLVMIYPLVVLTIQYNITLLPSVNTLIAQGMFCDDLSTDGPCDDLPTVHNHGVKGAVCSV